MRVLSIKQPWATLIVKGYKTYEFRSWNTKYRGEFLIHASKTVDKEYFNKFNDLNIDFPLGVILGKATLVDSIPVTKEFENELIKESPKVYGLYRGRTGYAFKLENISEIKPIPINGKLGFWSYEI